MAGVYYLWTIWLSITWKQLRQTNILFSIIVFFLVINQNHLDNIVLAPNLSKLHMDFCDFSV